MRKLMTFLFNPRGRITRKQFWLGIVASWMTGFAAAAAVAMVSAAVLAILDIGKGLSLSFWHWVLVLTMVPFLAWPGLILPLKRLRDISRYPWRWIGVYFAGSVIVGFSVILRAGEGAELIGNALHLAAWIAIGCIPTQDLSLPEQHKSFFQPRVGAG